MKKISKTLSAHCFLKIELVQYALDLRKPNLRKNLDLRKIVATTDFLVHKWFDLRKILGVAKTFLKSRSFLFQTQQNP